MHRSANIPSHQVTALDLVRLKQKVTNFCTSNSPGTNAAAVAALPTHPIHLIFPQLRASEGDARVVKQNPALEQSGIKSNVATGCLVCVCVTGAARGCQTHIQRIILFSGDVLCNVFF